MSGGRPYKEIMSKGSIIDEFKRCKGTQFDPELCDVFIDLIEKDIVCKAQLEYSEYHLTKDGLFYIAKGLY